MVFIIYVYVVMCTLLQLPSYLRVATIIANQFVLLLSKKGRGNNRDAKHLLYNCQVGKRPQLQAVVPQTTSSRKISFVQFM
ncbi:hypothetical protein HanRHA438_Chr06g0285091 [Helianthus annuus]|uniref:Uncharacterized protein n=1 Tax=Helianthus annuus TaxID=4232 RepID=A0A9K3IVY6_HELAN|nr:hypothetical protein HanXRQr2_Chr06g0276031 [Helianthus annuus]KAJ0561737.1 hypothetical protein HanHA300_Chr06g0226341 [Helianthus annuus]KAJ0568486.1 hypothetical protein HanIR_Chr06g0296731 [Helianthus annuus]KAJ0574801.1 hypothetical protein HanHA89_Chr06g0242291 [Helianthus annuus]KAJ0739132.1 hypothetical protein HanLR1_Chr06g0226201 [Helianthus annuus]